MPTFTFNKLVRNRLPDLYKQLGQQIASRRLVGAELLRAYRSKMIEEASEIPVDGGREETTQELADIEQLRRDMQTLLSITDEEVEAARQSKLKTKGGFSEGVFVETITLQEDDEWVGYYRAEPDKYVELQDD